MLDRAFKVHHESRKLSSVDQIRDVCEEFGASIAAIDIHLVTLNGEFLQTIVAQNQASIQLMIPFESVESLSSTRQVILITNKRNDLSETRTVWRHNIEVDDPGFGQE